MNITHKCHYLAINILLLIFVYSITPLVAQENATQFEPEIVAFEEADALQMPPKNAILFVGSSSIRMWNSLEDDFPKKDIINRGFGGSQFSDLLYYVDRIVVPYEPRQIFVYEGDNDVFAGVTPDTVLHHFKLFVSRIKKQLPGTEVLFISIKPSPSRKNVFEKMKQVNRLIENYADKKEGVRYIDVFNPMLTDNGEIRSNVFIEDNLHMNAKGYDIWEKVIRPYLN